MTSPRTHSQEVALAGLTPGLPIAKASLPTHLASLGLQSTTPFTARNRTGCQGQVPSPAGLGRSGASAITSLRSARPAARPPGAVRPAPGGYGAHSLCGPGSPGELHEGRRAPAKCSSGAASLNPPSYPWWGSGGPA